MKNSGTYESTIKKSRLNKSKLNKCIQTKVKLKETNVF